MKSLIEHVLTFSKIIKINYNPQNSQSLIKKSKFLLKKKKNHLMTTHEHTRNENIQKYTQK